MAGNRLTWVFQLFDRFSGPSKAVARHLDEIDRKFKKATRTEEQFERQSKRTSDATRKSGEAARKAGDGFGWFGLKLTGWLYSARSALSVVSGLARGVGGLAGTFLKAGIGAASFKESTMLGLSMMLRDRGLAGRVYGEAVNFADISPFETQDTLGWYRQLIGAGVGTKGVGTRGGSRVLKVLAGLGDIAASQADPNEAMGRIVMQVTQMLSKGRLLGEDLRPLAEAGVSRQAIYEILAKRHGISLSEAMSPAWEGKFGAGEGVQAILEFSAQRYGGGQLGGGMGPASRTFSGLLSTLASRPYRMMEDLGETAGFKSLKSALENLVNALDPSTATGGRIKKNIEDVFDRILGGVFKRFEDPKAVEAWINELLDGTVKLIPKIGELAKGLGDIAQALSNIAGVVNGMSGGWGIALYEKLNPQETTGWQQAFEKKLADDYVRLKGKGSLGGVERGQLEAIERELRQRGLPLPQLPSAPPPAPSMSPAHKSGGSASIHLSPGAIQFQIDGAQDPKAVGDEVEGRLASVFERLAMATGAA